MREPFRVLQFHHAARQHLHDLLVGPTGSLRSLVGLQQNSGVRQFPGWRFSRGDKPLELCSFVLDQSDDLSFSHAPRLPPRPSQTRPPDTTPSYYHVKNLHTVPDGALVLKALISRPAHLRDAPL